MFGKKVNKEKPVEEVAEKQEREEKEGQGSSPLLERYLQKNMTDQMQVVSDEVLAKAIKTLLYEDEMKNDKHWN